MADIKTQVHINTEAGEIDVKNNYRIDGTPITEIFSGDGHNHEIADVNGLQAALTSKANADTVYTKTESNARYYTQTQTNTLLSSKADSADVYTQTQVDTLLSGKANTSHTHTISQVTGLQAALDGKASASHTHTIPQVTNLQTELDGKANVSHTHTISQVTGLQAALDGKANTSHTHSISQVTGLQTELNDLQTQINGKANTSHTHTISQVTGLQTALDGKANTSHTHSISQVTGLQTALDGKASVSHDHSGVYAPVNHTHTISQVTGLQAALDGKANTSHTHSISQVTGLQTELNDLQTQINGKANTSHTHSISQVTNLQTELDGKADVSHTHSISQVTGLQAALDGKASVSHTHTISQVTGLQTELTGLQTQIDNINSSNPEELGYINQTTEFAPAQLISGMRVSVTGNTVDGLDDGSPSHLVMHAHQQTGPSSFNSHQVGLTANGGLWHRQSPTGSLSGYSNWAKIQTAEKDFVDLTTSVGTLNSARCYKSVNGLLTLRGSITFSTPVAAGINIAAIPDAAYTPSIGATVIGICDKTSDGTVHSGFWPSMLTITSTGNIRTRTNVGFFPTNPIESGFIPGDVLYFDGITMIGGSDIA
jgi:phage host-nuclease inhibitor protein Gam